MLVTPEREKHSKLLDKQNNIEISNNKPSVVCMDHKSKKNHLFLKIGFDSVKFLKMSKGSGSEIDCFRFVVPVH